MAKIVEQNLQLESVPQTSKYQQPETNGALKVSPRFYFSSLDSPPEYVLRRNGSGGAN
jgi:hypothetical protein